MVRFSDRLVSLDVFRGITMAAMVLVENPGKLCVVAFWLVPLWHMYKRGISIKV